MIYQHKNKKEKEYQMSYQAFEITWIVEG